MIGPAPTIRSLLLTMTLALPAVAQETPVLVLAPPASSEQVAGWVRDLDADEFAKREAATSALVAAGYPAIQPLASLDFNVQNLEVITRGLYVLQELALADDPATEEAAHAALERISDSATGPAARRAASTLGAMSEFRQQRAFVELERLGVKISVESRQVGPVVVIPNLMTVEVSDSFRGKASDLKRLKFLSDVQLIELSGSRITDEALAHVAGMTGLEYIIIKRTKVTNKSLPALRGLERLRNLTVMYSPLDDGAIGDLSQMKSLTDLRLFGTGMTRAGSQKIALALGVKVDYRDGAFLGISCEKVERGCLVTLVHPNSAAAKAGLTPGVVIATIDDEPSPDFEALTALIAKHKAGDKVVFRLQRDTEIKNVDVTLGAWE